MIPNYEADQRQIRMLRMYMEDMERGRKKELQFSEADATDDLQENLAKKGYKITNSNTLKHTCELAIMSKDERDEHRALEAARAAKRRRKREEAVKK